jgi:hypothetical protein
MFCGDYCKFEHEKVCFHAEDMRSKIIMSQDTPDPSQGGEITKMANFFIQSILKVITKFMDELGSLQAISDVLKSSSNDSIFDFRNLTEKNYISIISSLPKAQDIRVLNAIKAIIPNFEYKKPFKKFWKNEKERKTLLEIFDIFSKINKENLISYSKTIEEDGDTKQEIFGASLCAFGSLFNHSCDPNIHRFFKSDNKAVFYVVRPIKAGEQLFMTYGFTFYTSVRSERLYGLEENNGFNCKCVACKKNYPLQRFLTRKVKRFIEPKYRSVDPLSAIQMIEKNCEFINKNYEHYPSYELITLIRHNIFLLDEISRLKL